MGKDWISVVWLGFVLFATPLAVRAAGSESGATARHAAPTLVKWQNAPLLAVARADTRLIAVGVRGLIIVSDDEGQSWRQIPSDSDVTLTSITFVSFKIGFAVGHESTILRTDDAGLTWRVTNADPDGVALLRIRFVDATRGFVTGGGGTLLATSNGGDSWVQTIVTTKEDEFDPQLHDIARVSDGRLIAAGEAGYLFRSADGGASWNELVSPYVGTFFGLLSLGGSKIIAYGMLGHVFLSSDAGDSWIELATGINQSIFDAVATDDYIYLGGADGVLAIAAQPKIGRFDLRSVTGRPTIGGLLSVPTGLFAATDRGLEVIQASTFNHN